MATEVVTVKMKVTVSLLSGLLIILSYTVLWVLINTLRDVSNNTEAGHLHIVNWGHKNFFVLPPPHTFA